jgi:hypothetical protein
MACLVLFSCKKDLDQLPGSQVSKEKKYDVSFNASDFTQQVDAISKGNTSSESPLISKVSYFAYIVYNSEGKEVSRIVQDSTGATTRFIDDRVSPGQYKGIQTFGCIKDSLTTGNYTVVMIGTKSRFEINARTITSEGYYFKPLNEAFFYYEGGLISWSRAKDTFLKKLILKVESKDFQQRVILDRIVGKAEINILDSKPGTTFKFLFIHENEGYKFSNETPFGNTDDIQNEVYLESVAGISNLSYSKFLINTLSPVDVIIKVYENGTLTASKTIKDVLFYKNKRVILTGNIYSPKVAKTGFTIEVNDEFDKDPVKVNF